MEGAGGSKGKTAATRDKMKLRKVRREDPKSSSPGLGSKSCEEAARLRSPRLRSKSRVDYNENTQLSGGDLFGESVEYKPVKGILKKPSTESNDEEDEEVTFRGSGRKTAENPVEKGNRTKLRRSKRLVGEVESGQKGPVQVEEEAEAEVVGENDDGVIVNDVGEIADEHEGKKKKLFKENKASEVGKVKPNEVARGLALKRKRGEDAGRLESNDDLKRLHMKRRQRNSYSKDVKTEVVEKVKVVGNASKVARFYSSKLGFPLPGSTVREWVKKSQESQEDDVVAQVGEEDDVAQVGEEETLQDETEGEVGESEEDTVEEENNDVEEENNDVEEEDNDVEEENNDVEEENNDEEASEVDDDGEATYVHLKKNEGDDEAEVGVIFDTRPVLVETPLTEACKKLREVELKKVVLKKKKELLEMEEKKLQKEKEEQLLLLKKALE